MNVRNAFRNPRNFNIRLEYSGKNYENVSCRSHKFWACRSNGNGTVTVTFDGKLQTAPTVNGPWQDANAASPLTISADQAQQYGRAVR